jgi:hypothetical protein
MFLYIFLIYMLHKNQHVINTDNEHILHGLLDGVCVCVCFKILVRLKHTVMTQHIPY